MYLSGETSIFGIIGEPIQHSFSPAMQTVAFQKCNYNAVYLPFAVKKENLGQVISAGNFEYIWDQCYLSL